MHGFVPIGGVSIFSRVAVRNIKVLAKLFEGSSV